MEPSPAQAHHHSVEHPDSGLIAALNPLPGDFADLTLVTLSERLEIAEILSLERDFDVYRRFRREPFRRVSLQ